MLDDLIRRQLVLPAICAPMFRISHPLLVREACKAGIIGVLPRHNIRDFEGFSAWLGDIRRDLDDYAAEAPDRLIGPLAVNLSRMREPELSEHIDLCRRHGVRLFITALGDPSELAQRVHDADGLIYHDVTNLRFAEKAAAAGVDGLICIGAGGGGHSGTVSHLALIPRIREMFDGTLVLAGAVSNGATIRAAEILGADLCYLGTRFIATQEAAAPDAYKRMLVDSQSKDLRFTKAVSGLAANWLADSLRRTGLDPDQLPEFEPGNGHLPQGVRPWADIWSAGQGIDLIGDIPSVAELVRRLRNEYVAACAIPDMADVARLVEDAAP